MLPRLTIVRAVVYIATMMNLLIFAVALDSVDYPSAAAALEALKARGDVAISEQGGWTIADDKKNRTLWSFTPPGHPAHPAAVRRTVVTENGQASIKMAALCQAKREACDDMLEEFRRMNAALQQSLAPAKPAGAAPSWQPTPSQKARVEELSKAYFADKDAARYREAWERLGPGLQKQWTYEDWRDAAAGSTARAGAVRQRDLKKVTIYRSSQGGSPGTYAAVDFTGRFANADTYCGYLVWSEQADGSFLLLREEENYIYNATAARLTPEQRGKMRSVFRCAD
jgi:hypothetical protein